MGQMLPAQDDYPVTYLQRVLIYPAAVGENIWCWGKHQPSIIGCLSNRITANPDRALLEEKEVVEDIQSREINRDDKQNRKDHFS